MGDFCVRAAATRLNVYGRASRLMARLDGGECDDGREGVSEVLIVFHQASNSADPREGPFDATGAASMLPLETGFYPQKYRQKSAEFEPLQNVESRGALDLSRNSISIVIPSYNMDWCVARAIRSCQAQSFAVNEIIVVDDCSTDNTEAVVHSIMVGDNKIRYLKLARNSDHLAALKYGASRASSDWIVLLDADDELTANSIQVRLAAAQEYRMATGVIPQLVYGDLASVKFKCLRGYSFAYVCKELSLCQTSTMMLGTECVPHIPVKKIYHTDDEIVLAIARRFHVLHSGAAVAVMHEHNTPTGRKSNPWRVFAGVRELVRAHRSDILKEHGITCLLFWQLRIARAFVEYLIVVNRRTVSERTTSSS